MYKLIVLTMVSMLLSVGSLAEQADTPLEAVSDVSTALSPPIPMNESGTLIELAQSCCKICRKGKACGDSCIARNKVCHKGLGCACNGYMDSPVF